MDRFQPGPSPEDPEYFEMDNLRVPSDGEQLELEMDDEFLSRRTGSYHLGNKYVDFVLKVFRGPDKPQDDPPDFSNRPFLAPFERFPHSIRHRYPHFRRSFILIGYLICWFTMIYLIMEPVFKYGATVTEDGEELEVLTMSCSGDGEFWRGKNQQCGLDASLCLSDKKEIVIKCPALCDRGWIYALAPVGEQLIKYRQYAIGGGGIPKNEQKDYDLSYPYRADSYPCASAVHAGILSPILGGCLKVKFDGAKLSFDSKNGPYNTGMSVNFDSFFPASFLFQRFTNTATIEGCYDPRFSILLINFLLGIPLIYMASGAVAFWVLSVVGFWTIIIALDPPIVPNAKNPDSIARLFDAGFARFLPLCFVLYVMWRTSVKRTLSEPTSPIAKTILWYPLFWSGVANNLTYDRLPMDRLTLNDIRQLPGSFATFISLIITLVVCIFFQGYFIWKSGRFVTYLKLYLLILTGLITLSFLPGLGLRIHHYILGILFIPGTGTKGLSAFLLQGILLGLLISGVARWDFASIVESNVSLLRGEAGSSPDPPSNFTYFDGNISWAPTVFTSAEDHGLDGYSIIINDVERYVGSETSINLEHLISTDNELKKIMNLALSVNDDTPLYLRLGKSSTAKDSMERGDFTRAAVLRWPSGNWTDPEPGVS